MSPALTRRPAVTSVPAIAHHAQRVHPLVTQAELLLPGVRVLAWRAYRFINRPYYWYRPAQLLRRGRTPATADGSPQLLRTAWGSKLYCWPDPLGLAVSRNGVYDLTVTETLARLADSGETVVDVGANVGLMSSLLARAVGADGRVVSFEPHPLIFEMLARNVAHWKAAEATRMIEIRRAAVSSVSGTLPLGVDPSRFAENKGTASLEGADPHHSTDVEVVRLDDELAAGVGVLKLDVEGHELSALRGAESLLARGQIRDIIFEEHDSPPTPVTRLLEAHGYTVLGVRQGIRGPILCDPADVSRMKLWDPPALLATNEPQRARVRLRSRGWASLRNGRGRAAG